MTARLQLTLHLSIFKELSVLFVSKIKGEKKKVFFCQDTPTLHDPFECFREVSGESINTLSTKEHISKCKYFLVMLLSHRRPQAAVSRLQFSSEPTAKEHGAHSALGQRHKDQLHCQFPGEKRGQIWR